MNAIEIKGLTKSYKEKQALYFERQMLLAEELNIPVSIHDRDAHGDIMEVIRRHPRVKGILHSFSGSVEMAEELVSLGYMISFSGTISFTNARRPKEVAAALPHTSVLIETDCPYLAPVPYRGKRCESAYIRHSLEKMAELRGMDAKTLAKITTENAYRAFQIKNT